MRTPFRPVSILPRFPLAVVALAVAVGASPMAAQQATRPAAQRAEPSTSGVTLRAVEADARLGRSAAVVVEAGALVHTAILYPVDVQGRLQGGADAQAQATVVLDGIAMALRAAGSSLDQVARLHVYVADADVSASVDRVLAERFTGPVKPAVTLVESRLPHAGALVAMDAIGVTRRSRTVPPERIVVTGLAPVPGDGAHVAVQADGAFVIVSGRAAPGEFEVAVRGTMEQLRGDLRRVGLGLGHIVQVKAFLGDIARAADLQRIVASTFQGTAPPQVVTEWRDGSLPVEIELVATAPGATSATERLTLVEPISSRYSRVARVFGGRPIFVSGLTGTSDDPAAQVREVFEQLRRVLAASGSDMRHLVKATYYVSDKAADQEINAVRPSIYDATRPPAASKISVQGTGRAGKRTVIDMIAVTTGR
jgi:enamine deaminase RidA (YjgF/YER057c/UK114 family)